MTTTAPDPVTYLEPGQTLPESLSADVEKVLDRTNRKIAGMQSLDEAMNFLFDSTVQISPCDRLSLAFLDPDGGRLVAHWTRATYPNVLLRNGFHQDIRGSSLYDVVMAGRLRIIHDLGVYVSLHPASVSSALLVAEGIRSSITCPLRVEDRIVGVLFRSSRQPGAYTAAHLQMHARLAERLGQAVEKAYRIERLDAANRAYREMLAFVSHELKGPLATMMMNAEILKGGHVGPLVEPQLERLRIIIQQGEYLAEMIRDYLDLSSLEELSGLHHVQPCAFETDILEFALVTAGPLLAQQMMNIERKVSSGLPLVEGNRGLLRVVMVNLLGNAARYGRKGGRVSVRADRDGDRLRVSVWNEGAGFRPEDRDRLFRKFSRLPTPEHSGIRGTGVGLYSCWRIIQMHGGRIEASSEYGKWAEFRFEVPLRQAPAAMEDRST